MDVSSPETIGDAERKEDIDSNDDGDEFEKRMSLCGFRKAKGDWNFNTPATLNERKSHLSDNEKEGFEEQLNAGGGISGQRGHLRGEGREYWLTSSSSKERASGRFVTDEIPGNTPEEKRENLQTPPCNKAEITERVVATGPHVAFTSRVSPQEEFAKETGYEAREGVEQTFIPTYNKEGPLKAGILEIKKENKETAESDVSSSISSESEKSNIETYTSSDGTPQNTEIGEITPNSTFEKDGITYKTDDNGNTYMSDGKRSPNSTYELNGSVYTTDDKGRITSCEAKPQRSPENSRDNDAQREAGGDDRKENDQGGHIVVGI